MKDSHFHRTSRTAQKSLLSATVLWSAVIILAHLPGCSSMKATDDCAYPYQKEISWWQDARYGMFIHWGISSLEGFEISWPRPSYGAEKYDRLAQRFNPRNFDADKWVDIARKAGMKYMVLTAKHHDGFCLWDSKASSHNIMNTLYGKDICRQLADACHNKGMRLGWYVSVREWNDPDCSDKENGERYIAKLKKELEELLTSYGKIDILWFDYEGYPAPVNPREIFNYVRSLQPDIIINNRLYPLTPDESHAYIGEVGMFATPEQFVGGYGCLPWETCYTLSQSGQWSIRYNDPPKAAKDVIWATIGAAGGNGNMLMNVGPDSLGVIQADYAERLGEVGDWIRDHEGVLYGTKGGPWMPTTFYVSTFTGNEASLVVRETGEQLTIPYSSRLKIKSATVPFTLSSDSVTFIIPKSEVGTYNYVIKCTFENDLTDFSPIHPFSTTGSLTYRKRITATSSLSDTYMHCPSSANDDDPRTCWVIGRRVPLDSVTLYGTKCHYMGARELISEVYNTNAILEVDLDREYCVSSFRIIPRSYNIGSVSLEFRKGENWVKAASTENLHSEWKGDITPSSARHWRLNMNNGEYYFGIAEFQLFE